MKVEIKVPRMGESVTEATVGNILKPSGSRVSMDEELIELETEKVNQVLYAPQNGKLTLNVKTGEVVKIDQTIGYVDTEGKGAEVEQKAEPESKKKEETPKPTTQKQEQSARLTKDAFIAELDETVEITPVAAPEQPAPAVGEKRETRRKMSKIRKVIASRLVEALRHSAMLTTFNEIDLTKVIDLRNQYKETFEKKHGVKLGFMSFFVKAVVSALQAIPDMNSYIEGDEIVHREYYDIGIAVASERGLVVPVVRNCDTLTLADIEKAIESYAKRAKENKLSVDDLQGGGFTITNGGVFGSLLSTPIINPPQSGILGMHKIEKRPVVVNDQVVVRSMMYVALSYDHRIIDGKEAVTFLVHVKNILEDPSRLLLEV